MAEGIGRAGLCESTAKGGAAKKNPFHHCSSRMIYIYRRVGLGKDEEFKVLYLTRSVMRLNLFQACQPV